MKVLIINKKHILYSIIFIIILLLGFIMLNIFFTPKTKDTFNPIDNSNEYSSDLTGDGIKDTLKVISDEKFIDIKIISNNKVYLLSQLCDGNILLSNSSFWPLKIYVKNISRKNCPEIIIQGTKNNKSIQYVFTWSEGSFKNVFSSQNNILGILDSSSTRTPQCLSFSSSSGISSLNSFMLINNEAIDITKDCKTPPDLNNIISLIDIIQKDYEIDEIPDIFTLEMPKEELGLLWNLDKDRNSYSFQDGFFYDESVDANGKITSIKWRLTFEKYIKEKDDSSKSEFVLYATTVLTPENNYKISSIFTK